MDTEDRLFADRDQADMTSKAGGIELMDALHRKIADIEQMEAAASKQETA
jgi:hypothetical protein